MTQKEVIGFTSCRFHDRSLERPRKEKQIQIVCKRKKTWRSSLFDANVETTLGRVCCCGRTKEIKEGKYHRFCVFVGLQVRCRAEGIKLRSSVTRNGTSTCHGQQPGSNFHLVFWLYLIFRTCGEMAVIGSVLLLRIVTLNEDHERLNVVAAVATDWLTSGGARPPSTTTTFWWIWALVGLAGVAPLAGWIADVVGFGIAFLLGSVMMGMAALSVALAPPTQRTGPHPMLAATLAVEEDESDDDGKFGSSNSKSPPFHRISARDLRAILSDGTAVLILAFTMLAGMAAAVVPTAYYWYLLELGASRLMLGASVTAQWLVCAPFVLLLSSWLWRRCGHRYIFIIGLLLYSIRFLGIVLFVYYVI